MRPGASWRSAAQGEARTGKRPPEGRGGRAAHGDRGLSVGALPAERV